MGQKSTLYLMEPYFTVSEVGLVSHEVTQIMKLTTSCCLFAGDRQDAVPDEAGGGAEERGVHPAEPAAPRRRRPRGDVRDTREDLRRHGEAQR